MIITTARPAENIRRWWASAIVAFVGAAVLIALSEPPADAAANRAHSAPTSETPAPRHAGEPIMAIVSIKRQRVTVYDAEGWIMRAPVSTGTTGRETPAGVFSVLEKDKDHHSNLYDDASMPDMLRITWSGIALHGGPLPGYAASHGCIRMPYDFAQNLFDKARIGMRVIIAPGDVEPVEFSHQLLFLPNAEAVAAAPMRAETLAHEAAQAAKSADDAKSAAAAAAREAASLKESLRMLDRLKAHTNAELISAERAFEASDTDEAKVHAEDLKQIAAANVAQLETQLDAAGVDSQSKLEASAAMQSAAKETEAKRTDATKAAQEAKLALKPVSVFISRATQRLYVRRGFEAILEVPVTIRDSDKPIGTHVFTAMTRNDDASLRWTAVTIDGGDTAKGALYRVTIPADVRDRIAPTAVPGSSIIISDEPLNRETNFHAGFIVVLGNQPQGGLAMRRRPHDRRITRRNGRDRGSFDYTEQGNWDSQYASMRQRRGLNYYSSYYQNYYQEQ